MIQHFSSLVKSGELVLSLRNPETVGIFIIGADGLGASEATINIFGNSFNSATIAGRNLNLTLGVKAQDVELARHQLYTYFPIMKEIRFGIVTDHREVYVDGYVEGNVANIFNQQSHNILSVVCPSAYLTDVNEVVTSIGSLVGGFTFPFANSSLTEPLLSFAEILTYISKNILYTGEADTGVVIDLTFRAVTTSIGDIQMNNVSHDQQIDVDVSVVELIVGSPIQGGDVIRINTKTNKKSVVLSRSGIDYNIMNSIGLHTTNWIRLYPGNNELVLGADSGVDSIRMDVRHHNLYQGV